MHQFIAVNVGTGDAFFLERGKFSALVDGGKKSGFPKRFTKATGKTSVSVIVCTHNDEDHANGILEFLQNPKYHANECWLPASWMEVIHRLCTASYEDWSDFFGAEESLSTLDQIISEDATEITDTAITDQLNDLEDSSQTSLRALPLPFLWTLSQRHCDSLRSNALQFLTCT